MTATVILDEIRRIGFRVRAEGERLVVREVDRLPDGLRALLREQRAEVLDLLRHEAAAAADPPSQSALVYVPSLDREVWIASDQDEADRLRAELLAAEGDARTILLAEDVVKLDGQPRELVDATAMALIAFPGARVVAVNTAPTQEHR